MPVAERRGKKPKTGGDDMEIALETFGNDREKTRSFQTIYTGDIWTFRRGRDY